MRLPPEQAAVGGEGFRAGGHGDLAPAAMVASGPAAVSVAWLRAWQACVGGGALDGLLPVWTGLYKGGPVSQRCSCCAVHIWPRLHPFPGMRALHGREQWRFGGLFPRWWRGRPCSQRQQRRGGRQHREVTVSWCEQPVSSWAPLCGELGSGGRVLGLGQLAAHGQRGRARVTMGVSCLRLCRTPMDLTSFLGPYLGVPNA